MLRPVPKEPREDLAEATGDTESRPEAEAVVERLPRHDFEPVNPPSTVGELLAVTRLKFGQDLRQVSQALRIRQGYLEAIEQDRHADLPGLAYAVGFVRSYAEYLGLDGKALVLRYKDEAQGIDRKPNLVFPAPVQEAKVPTGALILVSLVLLALAYAGWTYFSRETLPPPARVAAPPGAVPAEAATPAPGDANASEATQPAAAPAPTPAGIAAEVPLAGTSGTAPASPAPGASLGGPLAAPLPAAGEALPVATLASDGNGIPLAPPAPAASGDAASGTGAAGATQEAALPEEPGVRVVIHAKLDSWVQIRDAKDKEILTRVLREGESYDVPDQPGLVLLTGNAGGLVISVDGKALPPLGAVGAVKRNVALDPDKLTAAN